MLNRRHIRIKVMQVVFAYKGSESDDLKSNEKFLLQSMDSMYDLYLVMLSLFTELHKKAEDHLEKTKQKFLATQEEKNPNTKFVDNQVLQLIRENKKLEATIEERKLNPWYLDFEYVDILFKEIQESDYYKKYMSTRTSNFKEDKNFIINIFTKIIAPNEKLHDYFEDKKITWADDLPSVNSTILTMLRRLKADISEGFFTPRLFKDFDDRDFAIELMKKTLLNKAKLNEEISKKTKNWDSDRIAELDSTLLQMAICEFQKFPSIPVKVTINEYLEIAKEYSTPKSSIFINGILDKLAKEYAKEGKLNKVGRGLM